MDPNAILGQLAAGINPVLHVFSQGNESKGIAEQELRIALTQVLGVSSDTASNLTVVNYGHNRAASLLTWLIVSALNRFLH